MNPITTSNNCFTIDATTTTMPDFIGYPLLIDPANMVKDTASLDAFIQRTMDQSPQYLQQFSSSYDCPGWMGQNQRFHNTYFQGMLTFLAQHNPSSCTTSNTKANVFVCQSSCVASQMGLATIFADPKFCSQSPSMAAASSRAGTLAAYDNVCMRLPMGNCLTVVMAEKMQAGFPQMGDGKSFCNPGGLGALINDPLCAMVAAFDQGVGGGNQTMGVVGKSGVGGKRGGVVVAFVVAFIVSLF
ncbi:hypothetical protein HDU98_010529 [Podochytrium sp. JEL0797]|nr:hypothetical protein HDU98_010529 [Podochytrium sp. JEL0797]